MDKIIGDQKINDCLYSWKGQTVKEKRKVGSDLFNGLKLHKCQKPTETKLLSQDLQLPPKWPLSFSSSTSILGALLMNL